MKRFLVPGVYHVATRLRTTRVALFWAINVLGVIAVISWSVASLPAFDFIVVLLVAFGAWQSVYEIGYLENDLITTQRERNPTLRLDAPTRARLLRVYDALVAGKVFVALILVVALVLFARWRGIELNVTTFVGSLVVLRLVYVVHNVSRNQVAIGTFALLQTAKFITMPQLFWDPATPLAVIAVATISVPLMTLEYASLPRFELTWLQRVMEPFPTARVVYYALLSAAAALVWVLGSSSTATVTFFVAAGLLCFRGSVWLWVSFLKPSRGRMGRGPKHPLGADDG